MSVDLTQAPTLGAAAALVVVIGYLLASNRADRAQQIKHLDAALKRIKSLEEEVEKLHAHLDRERELRRQAQDQAADALREVADVRARLDKLTKGG